MNKVIIVGHPASGLEEIEARLRNYGVKPPLPSRLEGLFPAEITTSLCKAHGSNGVATHTREADFRQIEPGPVWRGMVLDLLLGNVDQELWGWADAKAVYLLDYWRSIDPLTAFVLVYDEPQRALAEAATLGADAPDEMLIQQQLDTWQAYNGEMLRFFQRHGDRCLLVNSKRALQDPDDLVRQLQARISLPLQADTPTPAARADSLPPLPRDQMPSDLLTLVTPNPAHAHATLRADAVERYLTDSHLSSKPGHLRFYEELQAAANMPLHAQKPPADPSALAWKAFLAQRRLTVEILDQLHNERYLLLSQLHQAQEELERLHLNGKGWVKPQKRPAVDALLGAADRVKQQLSYRLGSTLVKSSHSVGGCLCMPFALLNEARRYSRDKKLRGPEKLPPIHTYDDADEAVRVKNHLSYRLGSVLVKHLGSPAGWFKLPFAMRKEIKAFRQSRKGGKKASSSKKS